MITLLLTATNLFSVKNYGEFEFWFALLKVVAIIGFIVLGVAAIFGLLPNSQVSGVSHLFDTQGFLPNGMGAVLAAMLTTMFSFMGTEIVTIAAAESKDPGKQITKATNSVICRIFLFYLVSIFIVGVLTVMLIRPDHRIEIVATGLLTLAVVAAGLLVARKRKAESAGRVALNN